jgi:hypothetical protein
MLGLWFVEEEVLFSADRVNSNELVVDDKLGANNQLLLFKITNGDLILENNVLVQYNFVFINWLSTDFNLL